MGETVEVAGGRVDKFLGDGIMALFGVDREPEAACRRRSPRPRRWRSRSSGSTSSWRTTSGSPASGPHSSAAICW
jgi:class 3 adenylate cyclase